jgi:pimeloyl-ACP methyl ester carboxylesterase
VTTYVLVPGAGGDSFYWHLVAPRLRARGHEVVAPDLPADDEAAGIAEYADAVLAAVGDRTGLTVVAQSMGAFSAPLLCDRADVRELALVAPMIPVPGETPGEWWTTSGQSEGRDDDGPIDVMEVFMHDVAPEVVADVFARGEPRQADRPFADPWPLDAWPAVPTRVLAARHDRLFPLPFMQRLARERLGIDPDVIDSGHLPALARPEDLARWLLARG